MIKLLLTLLLTVLTTVHANAAGRTVTLEWEAQPDAVTYEIEIFTSKSTQKPLMSESRLTAPQWAGLLRPGRYSMHVRGRDDRELAGEWSVPISFEVKLDSPTIEAPEDKAMLDAKAATQDVRLIWLPVDGSAMYSVVVLNEADQPVLTKQVKEPFVLVTLPAAMKYTWYVDALDDLGNVGKKMTKGSSFTIRGPAVAAPIIREPASVYVRTLEVEKPEEAQTVHVVVKHFDSKLKDFKTIVDGRMKKGTVPFKLKWPGGKYQVFASSESKYRAPSSTTTATFDVLEGDRSIEAENRAMIRQSIDRTDNWFAYTSYVVSSVAYTAAVFEENRNAKLSAFSSALVIGGGRYQANSHYGLFGNMEAAGFKVEGQSKNYMSADVGGIYRIAPTRVSDLKFKFGGFYRQAPQITAITNGVALGGLSAYGPLFGAEYWYSLTPKWALQVSALGRYSVGGTAAGGAALNSSLSYQAGLLGGYRFKKTLTALGGYSYHKDSYSFAADNVNIGQSGKDQIDVTGHFLQLLLEYEF